jgi:hypothetical protein
LTRTVIARSSANSESANNQSIPRQHSRKPVHGITHCPSSQTEQRREAYLLSRLELLTMTAACTSLPMGELRGRSHTNKLEAQLDETIV